MSDNSFHYIRQGQWSIPGFDDPSALYKIPTSQIWETCRKLTPELVNISLIDGYPLILDERTVKRVESADITYPVVICPDLPTPSHSRYKIIDGRHRLYKLKQSNFSTTLAFILPSFDIVSKFAVREIGVTGKRLEEWIDKYQYTYDRRDFK